MNRTQWLTLVVSLCGCAGVEDGEGVRMEHAQALTACEVAVPTGLVRLVAAGSRFAAETNAGVMEVRGAGCDLSFGWPEASGQLMDVDREGARYVLVTDDFQRAHFPNVFGDTLARLAPGKAPAVVASAGRGIWEAGIAPSGQTLWMTACGPQGVLDVKTLKASWELPHITAGVLPDDAHFWFMEGARPTISASSGVTEVEAPFTDLQLARCDQDVCGFGAEGLVRWSADGQVLRQESRESLGLAADEQLNAVTASSEGLYLTVTSPRGVKVRFVP